MPPVRAQIPFLPTVQTSTNGSSESDTRDVSRWVYLDGRGLFQVAAPRANISERLQQIERNLAEISQGYFQDPNAKLDIQVNDSGPSPIISINGLYLMTVTSQDANLRQAPPSGAANLIVQTLEDELEQARQERRPQYLIRQGVIAGTTGIGMIVLSWGVYSWQRRSKRHLLQPIPPTTPEVQPITTQLTKQEHQHFREVKRRLSQLAQVTIWGGGTLFMLGLFPYTRPLQVVIISAAQIPLKLGVVVLGTYVAVRLSYALIDRFTTAFINSSALLTPETSERLQLRVSTIAGVTKSIITIVWLGVGILLSLTTLGIDVVPLLAGASLVGVAVSLASQNLIKDAINGFLIIMEDQYALGDVINVGDVGGLVENLNLRMTQLRDAEGRLITIPNSEIKIVANLSSRWSRADLTIPVGYQTDIDLALKLIETVSLEMDQDPKWQNPILETPQVLGVDHFGDRGLNIRVWIKTQPLKQWEVAREYRRRLKIAFDKAGISIPLPQQSIWVNDFQLQKSMPSSGDGNGNS
ncbi:mechanosensitive ion channel family protein [Mastigocladopsis repens]|uniref:mechanosensitive ion channel family protein n=1 Tax=Mastigocladopsis repens TaxID=221287 RepID=UPI0006845C55|nr:mechanosensitive ion channel family protein [Mastigocladopsis repens]